MEPWVIDLLKTSPTLSAVVIIVIVGMRWHERVQDKSDDRLERMSANWLSSFKEVGEKCHDSHEATATMFYEQSCKGQEVLTHITRVLGENSVQLDRCARAEEERNRAFSFKANHS